jgi:hypothetical protein
MHNDDKLDQILDDALANYISQPRAGLEQRVLASVRADAGGERRWLRWSLVVGAAACLVIAVLLFTHSSAPKAEVARVTSTPSTVVSVPTTQPNLAAKSEPARKHAVRNRTTTPSVRPEPLPKLAQFPTPSPLTADEDALLGLVRTAKPETIQALSQQKAEPLSIAKIQIEEIQIEPLSSGGK